MSHPIMPFLGSVSARTYGRREARSCTTFGVSCVIHIALVGAAIAIGRDLVTPKEPAVLIADLTLIESPRLIEAPAPGPPAPARPKPEKLTLPKPIATPMPAPVTEPEPVETRPPLPPPAASEPSPLAREPAVASAPSTSFEASGDAPAVRAYRGFWFRLQARSDSWFSSFRTRIRAHGTSVLTRQKSREAPQTVLFHPDCDRRLRSCTESADPSSP